MKAELHAAFVWDCDACGQENWLRGIEADVDEEAHGALAEALADRHLEGIDDHEEEGVEYLITRTVLAPPRITCAHCGEAFETTLPSEEDSFGEDE